jgi:DNA-binding MarR family transcriptional regulator
MIHMPTRLKIVATLAALPHGDGLSFTRLQDMLRLTPGNLIIQLRKLEEADYLSSEKTRNGSTQKTTVTLTSRGPRSARCLHPGPARPARRRPVTNQAGPPSRLAPANACERVLLTNPPGSGGLTHSGTARFGDSHAKNNRYNRRRPRIPDGSRCSPRGCRRSGRRNLASAPDLRPSGRR